MKIAYRRMSGPIGLTSEEVGTRGLWFEKRKAFIDQLIMRGHQVTICNRLTKKTAETLYEKPWDQGLDCDIALIEFGSSNTQFYGNDLDDTFSLVNQFSGPKIFLCDDPDLPLIWDRVKSVRNWSAWYNAKSGAPLKNDPIGLPIHDFPFSSLQDTMEPNSKFGDRFVYLGRPNGRGAAIKELIASGAPWTVYGREKEWKGFGLVVHDPPTQPERAQFYNEQLGCLVLTDNKHQQLQWRTGRAYHAVLAGCPAVSEHKHFGFAEFRSASDLCNIQKKWLDPETRNHELRKQVSNIWAEKEICDNLFRRYGL